jgi:lipopolysaccharide export system permease protein
LEIVLFYYLLFIPTIFVQTAPVAVLLSTVYSLGNLNRHNEIIALRSSGISVYRILTPMLIFGLLLSMLVFTVNDRVSPKTSRITRKIKKQIIKKGHKYKSTAKFGNIAVYGSKNRIIYAKLLDMETESMSDVIIYEQDNNQNLKTKITASKAFWRDGYWGLEDSIIYDVDFAGRILGQPKFYSKTAITIKESPRDLIEKESTTEMMSYFDLKRHIEKFIGTGQDTIRRMRVDLHQKLALPFVTVLVILVGAPFSLKTNRSGGALMGLGIAVMISFSYYAIMAVSLALGKAGVLYPLLSAWLSNIIFLGMGIYFIKRLN